MIRTICVLLFCVQYFWLYAQVVPFKYHAKWGYKEKKTGKVVIKPIYDSVVFDKYANHSVAIQGKDRKIYF